MVGKQPESNQADLDNILAAVGSGLASATMTFVKDVEGSATVSENEDEEQIIRLQNVPETPTKDGAEDGVEEFS